MSNTAAALMLSHYARKQGVQLCLPQMLQKLHHRQYQYKQFSSYYLNRNAFRESALMRQQDIHRRNASRLYTTFILAEAARLAKMQSRSTRTEAQMMNSSEDCNDRPHEFDNEKADLFLRKSSIGRTFDAIIRMSKLAVLFAPSAILFPIGYVSDKANTMGWNYTVHALEKAGPTFIKLAQWASTRSDLFGEEATRMLSKLRDKTKPHAWHQTTKLLDQELGDNWGNILKITDHSPIGSGCIAQVYAAELNQGVGVLPAGTKLAIKVQHPGLCKKVSVDFYIMEMVSSFLENLPLLGLEFLDLCSSVRTFKASMIPQLNFLAELDNLARFRRNFDGDSHVRFPLGVESLSSAAILTESFCSGINILEFKASKEEKQNLARIGLEMVTKMIFLHDFVHGDLHPGNILVERLNPNEIDTKDSWWSKITGNSLGLVMNVIDCGLVINMGYDEHRNLVKILGSLTKKEGYEAGKLMIEHQSEKDFKRGRGPDKFRSVIDEELFCRGIEQIVVKDEENNFLENVGDYLADICYLACKHRVKLEAKFINAALACEIMEGIASKLYPEMEVGPIAIPMVLKAEVMHGIKSTGVI